MKKPKVKEVKPNQYQVLAPEQAQTVPNTNVLDPQQSSAGPRAQADFGTVSSRGPPSTPRVPILRFVNQILASSDGKLLAEAVNHLGSKAGVDL